MFGRTLAVVGGGAFAGPFALPLPVGSVAVIAGAAADVAKHAIPSFAAPRVSITFRRVGRDKAAAARTVPFGGAQPDVLDPM